MTAAQLNTWLTTVGTFVKSLDPNHLVTVAATPAIDTLGQNWLSAFPRPPTGFYLRRRCRPAHPELS